MKEIKPEDIFERETFTENEQPSLKRVLTGFDLIFLGVGAIIGAGIFVLTGIAAATKAGPAIILSYVVAGIACGFSALSYAELASALGGCGSAYGYARVGFGATVAWIIGWALLLEYGISSAAVAVGLSGYVNTLLESIGIHMPALLLNGPRDGGFMDLPAFIVITLIAAILMIGVKTSARINKIVVITKLIVIGIFIYLAAHHINFQYWFNFMPFGWKGVMGGAAFIFFAYIGFDAVSTAAEETINPQRNMPIGIIGSLIICTILYMIVSALLTLIVPYTTLDVSSPIANALLQIGYHIGASIVSVGAIAGLTTVILAMYYGLTRVILAMSRDKLFPDRIAAIHHKTRTPVKIIAFTWIIIGLAAAFAPLEDLVSLVNIGTLAAFSIVCAGVVVLRYTRPDLPRPFKVPGTPLMPALGVLACLYLVYNLSMLTWLFFLGWLILGLIFYFSYGYKRTHSKSIQP